MINKIEAQNMLASISSKQSSLKESIKQIYKNKFVEDIDVKIDSEGKASETKVVADNDKPASEKDVKSGVDTSSEEIVLTPSEKALILRLRSEKSKESLSSEKKSEKDFSFDEEETFNERIAKIRARRKTENKNTTERRLTAESIRSISALRKQRKNLK